MILRADVFADDESGTVFAEESGASLSNELDALLRLLAVFARDSAVTVAAADMTSAEELALVGLGHIMV